MYPQCQAGSRGNSESDPLLQTLEAPGAYFRGLSLFPLQNALDELEDGGTSLFEFIQNLSPPLVAQSQFRIFQLFGQQGEQEQKGALSWLQKLDQF